MSLKIKLFGMLFCISMLSACSSSKSSGKNDWSISIGAGGGITGGSSGYTIDGKGAIQSWRILKASSEKETTALFTLDCDSAEFYKTYLDLIHFDTIQYAKVGNWTSFVELREGEVAHRVSWTGEVGPRLVQSFHDLLTGFIQSRIKH